MGMRQQNLDPGVDACTRPLYDSLPAPVSSSLGGSVVANGTPGMADGGRPVSDQEWFRHWAGKHLLSDNLAELSDHEERVWWRLVSVASLEEDRWTTPITKRLAEKCRSTPEKLARALNTMAAAPFEMVVLHNGCVTIVNGEKWNEDKNGKAPSATAAATSARKRAERDRKRIEAEMSRPVTSECHDPVTTPVTSECHDHKEPEPEPEPEPEKDVAHGAKRQRKPKGVTREIGPDDIVRWEQENPTLDIPAFVDDYQNWTGSKEHSDQVRGFQSQLRIEWKRRQFSKTPPSSAAPPHANGYGSAGENINAIKARIQAEFAEQQARESRDTSAALGAKP